MRMIVRRPVLLTNITALLSGFTMFSVFVLVPNFVEMPHGVPEQWVGLVDYGFAASATTAGLYLLPGAIVLLSPARSPVCSRTEDRAQVAARDRDGARVRRVRDARDLERRALADRREPARLRRRDRLRLRFDGDDHRAETVRPSETGVASGMNTVMRTVGGVIGGQVGAALLTAHTTAHVPSVDGFETAFVLGAVAALIGAAVAIFITRPQPRRRRAGLRDGLAVRRG